MNGRRVFAVLAVFVMGFTSCKHVRVVSLQSDPGPSGNGVEPQNAPYTPPVEMTKRMNDALVGTLSPPAYFASKTYGLKFRYQVYVPGRYKPGVPAALMVFQDASSVYLGLMNTPLVLDNLIETGEMPVTIALFIDPGTDSGVYVSARDRDKRSEQYDAMDGKYARFLTEEIIPQVVRKKYALVKDPNGWAIAGQSSGGIAAFTAAWQRPDYFRKVLTQNGSFVNIRGGGAYPELVRTDPQKPLRVYLLSGTGDLNNQFGNWLEANKAMASALEAQKYDYRFRPGSGGHFPPLQAQADFADALKWLWRGYAIEWKKGKK